MAAPFQPAAGAPPGAARRRLVLLGAALVLTVAATRAPFLAMRLAGEEGANGRGIVLVAQGHLPRMIIARSAGGREFVNPAGHNLGGYLLPGALFAPVLRATGFQTIPQRVHAAVGLRGVYAALFAVALLFGLAIVAPERRGRAALLLVALTLPTLPLVASVQVNYDGAVTVLLVLATLFLFQRAVERRSIGWACAAGALLGFGKLEYVVSVAVALLIAEAVALRARLWPPFAALLVASILVWRRLDPENFNYGYDVIGRFWNMQGGTGAPLVSRALEYGRANLALLWPLYASLCVALVWSAARRRRVRALLPIGLSMAFILVGYHAVAWPGDHFPRYFAPCFPLAAILLAELDAPPALGVGLAALLLCVAVPEYVRRYGERDHLLSTLIHTSSDDLALARELEAHPRGCITVTGMDSGVSFYSSRASFACCFAQWTGWHTKIGESLCP